MSSQEYLDQVAALGEQCRGFVCPGQEKPWGLEWVGTLDPMTDDQEPQRTRYHTPAEALRVAASLHNAYSPRDYPQVTEPVVQMAAPVLYDYETAQPIRDATAEELAASIAATEHDGGAGVIDVDGRNCYVQE